MAWLPDWYYRKQITISASQVDETLTNFPLRIPLSQTDVAESQASGADLRFTTSDGTLLNYVWTGFTDSGHSGAYVQIPAISTSTGAKLYVYWGNNSATDNSDAESVWADYAFVAHLDESIDSLVDETSGYAIVPVSSPTSETGVIGNGVHTTGTSYLELDTTELAAIVSQLNSASGCAFSCILKDWSTAVSTNRNVFALNTVSTGDPGIVVAMRPDNGNAELVVRSGSTVISRAESPGWSNGNTGHIGMSISLSGTELSVAIIVDGVLLATNNTSCSDTTFDFSGASTPRFRLGYHAGYGVDAIIDEVRIRKASTSAAWLKFERANLMNSDGEVTLDEKESLPTVAGPYEAAMTDSFQTDALQAETYIPGIITGHTYGT